VTSAMEKHDVVIIGGGHNGLIVAAYLAKAKVDVCVVELQDMVGGCVVTRELTLPGFKHDPAGAIHMMIQANPMLHQDELGLKSKYGLKYVSPDVPGAIVFSDDSALVIYKDIHRMYESIKQFSKKDADSYIKFCEYLKKNMAPVGVGMFAAPPRFGAMMSFLDSSEEGREYIKIILASVQDIADEWFESPHMRAAFGRWASEEMIGPREKGTGLYVSGWPLFHTWGLTMPVGGSGALSEALASCIRDNGGTIKLNSPVTRVIVENGTAKGIVLKNGDQIMAKKAVVSNVNVKQLFLQMLSENESPAGFADKVRKLKASSFAPLVQAIALNEAPNFKAGGDVNLAPFVEISPFTEELLRLYDDYSYGVPNAGMPIMGIQTRCDPTRAPAGKHTLYLYHFEPYHLRDGGAAAWDSIKMEMADRVLETARRHCTNLDDKNILGKWTASPLDYERINPALIEGDIGHIGSFLNQSFGNRPLPGWGQYKTPIQGLYMCGASAHPGVGITGGGRATVRVIMEDLGIDFKKVIGK
jgi:phytoene dehydrogenase-like protein